MVVTSTFTASVEDSDAAPVVGGSITISAAGARQRTRLTEVAPGQYTVRDVMPGEYDVRLFRRGYLTGTYRLWLALGANSRGFVMGRRGELFYYAGGLRVYFRPVVDRVLLAVYGPDAERKLYSLAADRTMAVEQVQPSPPAG